MTQTEKFAFRMNLNAGQAAEYKRRHDHLFPEMGKVLKDAGVSDYSIWLDPETNHLFAVLTRTKTHGMDSLAQDPTVRRWWAHMADVMETKPDNEPVQVPLEPMFYLA